MIVASFIWTKHWNATEEQTDGRTDRQTDRNGLAIITVVLHCERCGRVVMSKETAKTTHTEKETITVSVHGNRKVITSQMHQRS